jgi:hypothetical protein
MTKWTTADIPDQTGRVAVITGANTGLGYETAATLADHGAHAVLAVRNLDKGKDAAARIATRSPGASVALQELDLTSLESIRAAAEQLRSDHDRIDLLINNACVMMTPEVHHEGWLRAAVRHKSPGALRVHGAATGSVATRHRLEGRDGQQHRTPHRANPVRRSAIRPQLQPDGGVRAVQTGESAVHL